MRCISAQIISKVVGNTCTMFPGAHAYWEMDRAILLVDVDSERWWAARFQSLVSWGEPKQLSRLIRVRQYSAFATANRQAPWHPCTGLARLKQDFPRMADRLSLILLYEVHKNIITWQRSRHEIPHFSSVYSQSRP